MLLQRRSRQLLSAVLLVAALLVFSPASEAKRRPGTRPPTLDRRIEAILRRTEAHRGFWGIVVVRLPEGAVLYTRNPEHLFLPASNMKLFTTAAAIEKLGPDFVFRTTVESDAAPDAEGRVGDLILIGRGDPNLGSRVLPYHLKTQRQDPADAVFQKLADRVAARGVREIAGNLVADDSYFVFEPYGHGWAEEDLEWGYGAPVTALAFNDNAFLLRVQPGAAVGETARVWLDPIPDYYKLNNHLATTAARTEKRIFIERAPGSTELDVWGQIPIDKIEDEDTVAIANPPQLIGQLFRAVLEARGVSLRGRVEVRHLTRLEAATTPDPFPKPPRRVVLAEHVSLPLREDIKVINKASQNLHAEMLLRTLGREMKNYGSLTGGLEVLEGFATEVGIVPAEVHFTDGSGLSREALVTPRSVVKLLAYMARSPRFEVFFDSLPVAGVDGTLAERFKKGRVEGRIHAKTGTMEHINALSGYLDLPSGSRLAFSILGNSHPLKSREGIGTVDRLALAIFEWFAAQEKVAAGVHPGGAPGRGL